MRSATADLFIQSPAHEVVELVLIHRSTGRTVSGGHFIGQDFEFGDGFSPGFVGEQEILEHLTGIAVVGSFGNGEQTGGDGVSTVVARCVNAQGRIV